MQAGFTGLAHAYHKWAIGVCRNCLCCKNALTEAILLLHGTYIDDFLVAVVVIYLVIMFALAQRKRHRLKQEKLRRQAERRARQQALQGTPQLENLTTPTTISPAESDPARQ